MAQQENGNVVAVLSELKEDAGVPKNVKLKIDSILNILNEKTEKNTRISKILSKLEEIADDINLQPYARTQIWDAISLLSKTE